MNVVRKHISRVKGGQLAAACHPAQLLTLLISDVSGDEPGQIASGPTVSDRSLPSDALAIVDRYRIDVPASVRSLLDGPSRVVAPNDVRLARVETRVIAAPSQSIAAAAESAGLAGCDVRLLGDALEGEARELGTAQALLALSLMHDARRRGRPLLLLSGGECTVKRSSPLRPTTVRNNRNQMRQLLDAAVQGGMSREQFKTLADVVRIDVLKAAFPVIRARSGRTTPPSLFNLLCMVVAIARSHLSLPPEDMKKLLDAKRALADKLDANRPRMSEKNIVRLAQFDDPQAILDILRLPSSLMDRALTGKPKRQHDLEAMRGVAIAILLACPLRMGSLSGLDVEQNLQAKGKGKTLRYTLIVPPEQVKNSKAMVAPINAETSWLIQKYLVTIRGRLSTDLGTALFPRPSGGPRSAKALGEDIFNTIHKHTGLTANPHLFRALAVKIVSEAFPGLSGVAQRIVGHKKAETTEAFYAPIVERKAFEVYEGILSKKRGRKK